MTAQQDIERCGGSGRDFNGERIAKWIALPDNLAATALHIKFDVACYRHYALISAQHKRSFVMPCRSTTATKNYQAGACKS